MKTSLLLVAVAAASSLFACTKKPDDAPQPATPTTPTTPTTPPGPADGGLDTLGAWTWARDAANKVEGSQVVFVSPDTGYVVNNIFHPTAGMKATYDGGRNWIPDNSHYFTFLPISWSRLTMVGSRKAVLHGPSRPYEARSSYEPVISNFTFTSTAVLGNATYLFSASTSGQRYTFVQDLQYAFGKYYTLGDLGRLYTVNASTYAIGGPYSFDLAERFISVRFTSPNRGWAGSEKGKLLTTTDGGTTWTQQLADAPTLALYRIVFFDANRGWIVTNSNVLFRTTDGGTTWQKLVGPGPARFEDPVSLTRELVMVSATRGFLNVGRNIYETTDAGTTWTRSCRVGQNDVRSLSYDRGQTLWAITGGGLLKLQL